MNTNCLVTKLKSIVNNDNLEILGQIRLLTESIESLDSIINIMATKNVIIKSTDSLRLNNLTELTLLPNKLYTLNISGNGYLIICDKYAISSIEYINCKMKTPIDEIKNMTALKNIRIESLTIGNLENFLNYNPSITNIRLIGGSMTGNLENIDKSKLNQLSTVAIGSAKIKGNINVFTSASLTKVYFNDCKNVVGDINVLPNKQNLLSVEIYDSGISGSLDEYVASAISSGKTTAKDFVFTGAITRLTFGGNKLSTVGINPIAPCFVSWDSTGKISVKTGSYDKNNVTHVYCKGYTLSEAEAAFPSKTIIRVDA